MQQNPNPVQATPAQQLDSEFHATVERVLDLKYEAVAEQDFALATFWRDTCDYMRFWYFELMVQG